MKKAIFILLVLSGCASVEQKFQTYYSKCEQSCKTGQEIKVKVSTLEMEYQCECGK